MNTLKFDNMIWALGSGNQTPQLDAESQQAMIKLVEVIDQLAPVGDDNRRDLWFSMPRATFEEYHRYHDDEDYTEEEIQSLYHSEYPDELCWYSLTSSSRCSRRGILCDFPQQSVHSLHQRFQQRIFSDECYRIYRGYKRARLSSNRRGKSRYLQ